MRWRYKRIRILRAVKQKLQYAATQTTQFTGLNDRRLAAANQLVEGTTEIIPAGTIDAGGDNLGIKRWQAGKDGPVFLEKITTNHCEFEFAKQMTGTKIQHSVHVLGAVSHLFRYHVFMSQLDGNSPKANDPKFDIKQMMYVGNEFSQSVTTALSDKTHVPRLQFASLRTPWVQKKLAENDINIPEMLRLIKMCEALPWRIHHHDFSRDNALIQYTEPKATLKVIDIGSLTYAPLGADLMLFARASLLGAQHQAVFLSAADEVEAITGIDVSLLRISGLMQAAERSVVKAINKAADKFLIQAGTLINLAKNELSQQD
jgi:hypothetical protein